MADSNIGKRAEQGKLAENDPFAELTRIMGHQPGESPDEENPQSQDPQEDLALDLEQELMGGFSLDQDDLQGAEEAPSFDAAPAEDDSRFSDQEREAPEPSPEETLTAELDQALNMGDTPDAPAESHERNEELEQVFGNRGEELPVEAEPSEQPHSDSEMAPEPDQHTPIFTDFRPLPSEQTFEAHDEPQQFSDEGFEVENPVEPEAQGPDLTETQGQDFPIFVDVKPLFPEPSGESFGEPQQAGNEIDAAEPEEPTEPEPQEPAPAEAQVSDIPVFTEFRPLPGEDIGSRGEPQHEADDFSAAAFEPVAAEQESFEQDAQEAPQDTYHPGLNEESSSPADFAGVSEPQDGYGNVGSDGAQSPVADAHQDLDPGELLSAEELAAGLEDLYSGEAGPAEPVPHAPSHPDIPPAEGAAGEAQHPEWHFDADAGEPSSVPSQPAGESAPLAPEIETVDVPEKVMPLSDNLEIPEVSYREETQSTGHFDEIEEILAGAFGDPAVSEDRPGEEPSQNEFQTEEDPQETDREDDDGLGGMAAAGVLGGGVAAGLAGGREDAHSEAALRGDWDDTLDWNDGPQASLAPEPGVAPPPPPGQAAKGRWGSRALLAGCVVGAVAILGGVTVYALNFGDSGSSGPIKVSAEDSPVKVKPEDPGGVEIPNQDNQVYKRVSGEDTDTQPAQASLVTTTEDPLELPQAGIEANASADPAEETAADPIPGVERSVGLAPPAEETDNSAAPATNEEGASSLAAARDETPMSADESDAAGAVANEAGESGDAGAEKIEDRLAATDAEASSGSSNNDVVSLAPRRVRSLVVRPDGTMVPNEASAAESAATDGGEGQLSASADAEAAAQEGAGTGISVPESGPIPPSRPTNVAAVQPPSQSAADSAPAQQQPNNAPQQQESEPQQPAEQTAAVSSQQSGGSAWSVQIASQPTPEGAQASYQSLAQRFGNVLEGRGVNIVKADIEGRGTFYRVRIPSSSKDDAIGLCEQLKAAGGSCFVSQ